MKKLGVFLLLIVIFFSPLVSLVGAPSVYAIDDIVGGTSKNMRQVFPPSGSTGAILDENQGHNWILKPDSVSIVPGKTSTGQTWQPTSDTMKFHVTLKLHEENIKKAQDTSQDGENKGKVDTGDDIGDWDSIFDTDMENSRENGVFLFINKVNSQPSTISYPLTGTNTPATGQTNTSVTDFSLVKKNGKPATAATLEKDYFVTKTTGTGSNLTINVMKISQSRTINISHFILRDKPSAFFNKGAIDFEVAVTGLDPNTNYTYGILVVEDVLNENSFRDYASTHDTTISPSNSFTTLAAGTPNPNGESASDSLNTSGSVDGNNTASQEALANTIFGQEVKCEATSPTTWFSGCLLFLYHIIYQVSSWILRIAAGFMDIFMAYSLSDYMYRNGFIQTGWSVVRDVCNMLFIFILLWTAFKMVINDHHFNAKQVIVNVLIIGIFINFSLFFSKVVIDLGNISARVFYNQIRISGTAQDDVSSAVNSETLGIQPVAISEAIANGIGFGQIESTGYSKMNESAGLSFGVLFMLITLGIILNLFAAFILIKVSFAFLGRILSLWMAMVFSPFAFTSTILSGGHGHGGPLDIQKIGWHDWLKNLLNAAFYPAIFLFFLLLITILIQDSFLKNAILANDNLNGIAWIVTFLLNAAFLLGLLKVAGDMGSKMAGTFGEELASLAGKAAGFVGGAAIGVATGGMAMAGQKFMGARANAILSGDRGKDLREKASLNLKEIKDPNERKRAEVEKTNAQKKLLKLEEQKSKSYDFRETKSMQTLSNVTGLNFNAGLGKTKLGVDSTAGGWQAMKDRKAFKINENEEKLKKILGDKKIIVNGVSLSPQNTQTIKDKIKEHEENVENDSGVKNIKKELERIEEAIKNGKDKKEDVSVLVEQRKAETENLKDRKQALDGTFKAKMATEFKGIGFEDKDKKVGDLLFDITKAETKAKDGYAKDYLRNRTAQEIQLREKKALFNLQNDLGTVAGITAGAAVVGALGPTGALVGTIAGLSGGGNLLAIQKILKGVNRGITSLGAGIEKLGEKSAKGDHADSMSSALHDIEAGHVHAPHAHSHYHTPHGSYFSNLFKGGGGGGHGGGGHDDHGGHH